MNNGLPLDHRQEPKNDDRAEQEKREYGTPALIEIGRIEASTRLDISVVI